ncbi:hypothetical protein JCM11641_000882 [Rhodosporidiobolus odoratus]
MRERTPFPRDVLSQLPNLRFICTTGMRNRAIELDACNELGIVVSGTSRGAMGSLSTGTVEQTWALVLALARRIPGGHQSMQRGGWQTGIATGLAGKTLGVIGVGNLGTEVAKVGRAFGMRPLGWSPNLTRERAEAAGVEKALSLEDLLKQADVVTIHLVSSDKTRGLLGQKELALLKPTAILVNTSRGPIVQEEALLEVLRDERIRGAGLDVYDVEPLPREHDLRRLDNVVLSPHMGLPIDISPEIQQAQAEGRAVVALESTLITHGLPPPSSYNLALDCEALLRDHGVAPATIAILDGRIKVGLSEKEVVELAERGWESRKNKGKTLWKVGRRELGGAVVKRIDGGTTVSGTMAVAHLAGIKVFSTGGIGGVHRGAETSFDISSDLQSLSDTPVAVVCAGSKSILDIGLTLEKLEALAVPVAGYKTSDWPAFYTAKSGFKVGMQLDSASEVAEVIRSTERLSLPSSLLLGNPIPSEYHQVGEELQRAVDQAVAESVENGMSKSGKEVTPWLLQRVNELTEGRSLESNKALIKNNVKVGGEVALEYAKLLKEEKESGQPSTSLFMPSPPAYPLTPSVTHLSSQPTPSTTTSTARSPPPPRAPLVVAGALAVDITMSPTSSPHATTSPGSVSLTLGGVAGNVSGAAHSLLQGNDTLLISPVGDDLLGEVVRSGLRARGMRSDGLLRGERGKGKGEEGRTATCGILLDQEGGLVGGVADMAITKALDGKKVIERLETANPRLVCFDANLNVEGMAQVLKYCDERGIQTFFEPTSNAKSLMLLSALESPSIASLLPLNRPLVTYSAPNNHELSHLFQHIFSRVDDHAVYNRPDWFEGITVRADDLSLRLPKWVVGEGIAQMAVRLLPLIGTLFVKSGERGVLVAQRVSGVDAVATWRNLPKQKGTVVVPSSTTPSEAVILRHYPAQPLVNVKQGNVTGAGDNLAGAILAAVVRGLDPAMPDELDRIVDLAQRAAIGTLGCKEAVGDHGGLRELLPPRREAAGRG